MVSLETPVCDFGASAIDFNLPGIDNRQWTLEQCRGPKGLLQQLNNLPGRFGAGRQLDGKGLAGRLALLKSNELQRPAWGPMGLAAGGYRPQRRGNNVDLFPICKRHVALLHVMCFSRSVAG